MYVIFTLVNYLNIKNININKYFKNKKNSLHVHKKHQLYLSQFILI